MYKGKSKIEVWIFLLLKCYLEHGLLRILKFEKSSVREVCRGLSTSRPAVDDVVLTRFKDFGGGGLFI